MAINLNNNNNLNQPEQPNQPSNNNQQQKQQGSGFTNIQRVLGANQNNKLGQTVSQGVENVTNKAQTQAQDAQNKFATDIGKANQDIMSGQNVQQNLSGIDFAKDSNAAQNALQGVNTDQNAAALQNLRGGYQGPQGLQNAEQLQQQAQDASQLGQGLRSNAGRQATLQRFVNPNAGYTSGERRLDSMLLDQNANQLKGVGRQAQVAGNQINQQVNNAGLLGQSTGQQYNALGQAVDSRLTGLGQNLGGALDTRAVNKVTEARDYVSGLQKRLLSGDLSQDDYNNLVSQTGDIFQNGSGQANTIYSLGAQDIGNQLNARTDFNRSNVATQGELGARNALMKLANKSAADLGANLDEAQVGSAVNAPLFTADQGNLKLKLGEATDTYNKQIDPYQKAFDIRNTFSGQALSGIDTAKQTMADLSKKYGQDFVNQLQSSRVLDSGGTDQFGNPIHTGNSTRDLYARLAPEDQQKYIDALRGASTYSNMIDNTGSLTNKDWNEYSSAYGGLYGAENQARGLLDTANNKDLGSLLTSAHDYRQADPGDPTDIRNVYGGMKNQAGYNSYLAGLERANNLGKDNISDDLNNLQGTARTALTGNAADVLKNYQQSQQDYLTGQKKNFQGFRTLQDLLAKNKQESNSSFNVT